MNLKRVKIMRLIPYANAEHEPAFRRQVYDRAVFSHMHGMMQRQ